jgi:hypothetical protein
MTIIRLIGRTTNSPPYINGKSYPIMEGQNFDADVSLIEVLTNAGVRFRYVNTTALNDGTYVIPSWMGYGPVVTVAINGVPQRLPTDTRIPLDAATLAVLASAGISVMAYVPPGTAIPINAILSRIDNQPLTSRIDGSVLIARVA